MSHVPSHSNNGAADLGPADLTLDAPSGSEASCVGAHCQVQLVEGSGVALSGEVQQVLRRRLRSAALLQFAGFATFLLWHLFIYDEKNPLQFVVFVTHIVTTLILGALAIVLSWSCQFSTPKLRWLELVAFGVPMAFFAILQHERAMRMVDFIDFHPGISSGCLLTIYTYALFIPNTWKRAAAILTAMGLVPLLSTLVTVVLHTGTRNFFYGHANFGAEMVLTLILAVVGATWGVYTISTLQTAAFEARQLGQYRLKRLIGSGGMGEVYLGEHQLMKRPCAIKVIRAEKAGDPKVLARFEREVQATAKLSHWNSIDIFDYGRAADGTFYYVMEYLPGMNLSELVKRFGPLAPGRAIHFVRQACDALHEAHQLGLLHRDLKPANLFAAVRGGFYDVTKLLDFGLAKPLTDTDDSDITAEGSITGSPLYMSPEQATGDTEPDVRSDIYSLGGVLYFLTTGRPPFESDKPLKVLISHAHEAPQPPTNFRPDLPQDLEAVIMRCLNKHPDDRYQTSTALGVALEGCEVAGTWKSQDARQWWEERELSHDSLYAEALG